MPLRPVSHYAVGGDAPVTHGRITTIEHAGRRGWRMGSVHDRLSFPRHTVNANRGSLVLQILPLEDFATCVQIPHTLEREPGAWSTVLLSDDAELQTRQAGWPGVPPGAFALVYSRDWYHQLYAKFYRGNIYMDAYTPGQEKALVTVGHLSLLRHRWVTLTLTWDRAASDYRLYADGVFLQRSSDYAPLAHEACGDTLYAGSPAFAWGELSFYDEVLSPEAISSSAGNSDAWHLALKASHAPRQLPAWESPLGDESWTTVCERSLKAEADQNLFHVQGMQDVLKTTPDGLEIRTSAIHPMRLPRPADWPAEEPFDLGQTYLWLEHFTDGDLWLEFDFMPLQSHGLALLMLQAHGMHREDFMADYPRRRTGAMRMVCWENVRNYHWEFYRQMEDCRHDRASHVLVKNPVLRPLAYQAMPERLEIGRWHRLAFVQERERIRGAINGQIVFDVTDSPHTGFGPVYDCGRLALRCMYDTWMKVANLTVRTRTRGPQESVT